MGRISNYSDAVQKLAVKRFLEGKDWTEALFPIEIPTKRTLNRWIIKWKDIIIAEQEAEKLVEIEEGHKKDIKRHKKTEKRHKKTQKKLTDHTNEFVKWINTLDVNDYPLFDVVIRRIQSGRKSYIQDYFMLFDIFGKGEIK
ncbi:MAG: hypothetical protein ACTSP6_06075 [Promethearchaeota archaeon]